MLFWFHKKVNYHKVITTQLPYLLVVSIPGMDFLPNQVHKHKSHDDR